MAPKTIDIARLLDRPGLSGLQARTICLAACVMLLDGADSLAIGLAAPGMARSLDIRIGSFGAVFGIGQAGVMVGALGLGVVADRIGRKAMIVAATTLFGLFTLLTPACGTLDALLACRFVAGVGLGGATPNAIALVSEYAPRSRRVTLVALLWAAFPLGGALVGLASARLIPAFGWQSLFLIGGTIPVLLALLLVVALPESLSFLVVRGRNPERQHKLVSALAPDSVPPEARFVSTEQRLPGVPLGHLFRDGRSAATMLLWIAFFTSFLILIFIVSWIPTLLKVGGLSVGQAGVAIACHSFGSVIGSALVGRTMEQFGRYRVLMLGFGAAALASIVLGYAANDFTLLRLVIGIAGLATGAAQAGVIALAATLYPVAMRSTGVGWAIALGRLGAVCGPLIGGALMAAAWSTAAILAALAVPALTGLVAVAALGASARHSADPRAQPLGGSTA